MKAYLRVGDAISISSAIQCACDGADYERGQIEAIDASTKQTAQLLGRLVDILISKALLDTSDVETIVGYVYNIKEIK